MIPMRLNTECMNCLLRGQLQKYPDDVSEAIKIEYMQKVMEIMAKATLDMSAPVIVRDISRVQKELFGYEQDYKELKRYYNQMMMDRVSVLKADIRDAEDPLKRAMQYAMTGNYIDFAAAHSVTDEKLNELLDAVPGVVLNENEYHSLCSDLKTAKHLVYLTDNCGEVVLDKLLMEEILREYPDIYLTVIVRGAPAVNDATMEDAGQVGLLELADVIGNGNDIGGTWQGELSAEAAEALESADVILSKGQGNFETLQGCGLNIYYLFMCKCRMFTKRFKVNLFEGILINDKNSKGFE